MPIIVATPGRMRAAMKLVTDAQDLLQKGSVAGAKRNVDTVLQRDPTFWPRFTCALRFTHTKPIRPGSEGLERSAPARSERGGGCAVGRRH